MNQKQVFLFILVLILLSFTEQQRKRKKTKKQKKEINPIDLRPETVSKELWCDICIAIIKEATKELRRKKKESDVIEYLTEVCNPEKYYTYHHPPPEMRTGCDAFVSVWDQDIEKVLINRENDEKPIRDLCYEKTKACDNVDPSNVKKFDDQIFFDGQPKKIKDGKIAENDDEDL